MIPTWDCLLSASINKYTKKIRNLSCKLPVYYLFTKALKNDCSYGKICHLHVCDVRVLAELRCSKDSLSLFRFFRTSSRSHWSSFWRTNEMYKPSPHLVTKKVYLPDSLCKFVRKHTVNERIGALTFVLSTSNFNEEPSLAPSVNTILLLSLSFSFRDRKIKYNKLNCVGVFTFHDGVEKLNMTKINESVEIEVNEGFG